MNTLTLTLLATLPVSLLSADAIAASYCNGDTAVDSPAQVTYDGKISEQMLEMTVGDRGSDSHTIISRIIFEDLSKPTAPTKLITGRGYDTLVFNHEFRELAIVVDNGAKMYIDKIPPGNHRINVVSYDDCGNGVKQVLVPTVSFSGSSAPESIGPEVSDLTLRKSSRTCIFTGRVIDRNTGLDRVEVYRDGVALSPVNFYLASTAPTTTGPIASYTQSTFVVRVDHACKSNSGSFRVVAFDAHGNQTEITQTVVSP